LALVRRVDTAAVIGRGLLAAAAGLGHRKVAEELTRPDGTVRGWLRRARRGAGRIEAHFSSWAQHLDPTLAPIIPAEGSLTNAVEAIGAAARAASLRLGPSAPWCWASALSAGALICNTNCPWPSP
jgi:hypothetical protein